MTNNHCPDQPARVHVTRQNEIAIRDFSEKIIAQIEEFAAIYSMEMLIIDPRIADSWTDCSRCESIVTSIQGDIYGRIIQEIVADIESEF